MTFKVGDRVRLIGPNWPSMYSDRATVVKELDDEVYGVRIDDYPYKDSDDFQDFHSSFKRELEIVPELVEVREGEERKPETSEFSVYVSDVLDEVRDTLIAKNKAYGNAALEPVRVFSTADPVEQLRVRIDDKLSRLKSSLNDDNEDTVLDLMGYLVLLRIATRKQDSE